MDFKSVNQIQNSTKTFDYNNNKPIDRETFFLFDEENNTAQSPASKLEEAMNKWIQGRMKHGALEIKISGSNQVMEREEDGSIIYYIFDENGKQTYSEHVEKSGLHNFSTGTYGNNLEEAVNNVIKLMKQTGYTNVHVKQNSNILGMACEVEGFFGGRRVTMAFDADGHVKGGGNNPIEDAYGSKIINAKYNLTQRTQPINLVYLSLKQCGANEVTGLALNATFEASSIVKHATNSIKGFMSQINAMEDGRDLPPKEFERKIKALNKKIEAAQKEAEARIDMLTIVADSLLEVYKIILQMKSSGTGSSEITDFMSDLIKGAGSNSGSLDFSKIKNGDEDIEEIIYKSLNSLYGKDTTQIFEDKKEDLQKQIEDLTNELTKPDLDPKEANKIKTQIQVFTFEFNMLNNISEFINSFKPDKDDN